MTLFVVLLLQAYMHGFFMDMKLYSRVQAVADPFAFERHRKERCVLDFVPCCIISCCLLPVCVCPLSCLLSRWRG